LNNILQQYSLDPDRYKQSDNHKFIEILIPDFAYDE